MPNLEFWFTGYAVVTAAGFLFALVLAALGVGPVLTKQYHRRIVWSGIAILVALTWWQLAKKAEEDAKPERDYAYLIPSAYLTLNGLIYLSIVSTGTMRNVRIAVRRIGSDGNPEPFYIYFNGMNGVTVDEETHVSNVMLAVGSYAIDIDPPTKYGKVDERLKFEMTNGSPTISVLRVVRKGSLEVLIPPPEKVPFTHKLLFLFFVFQFLAFASTLAWASWVAT
jgi:hypothetical protein